jgi:hypothetical protein
MRQVEERMMVLSDTGFHAAEGDPANLTRCQRGAWQDRLRVETVLAMLRLVCHCKKVMHRGWASFQARLAFTMAAFNVSSSGMAASPPRRASSPFRWRSLVCRILNSYIVCKGLTLLVIMTKRMEEVSR